MQIDYLSTALSPVESQALIEQESIIERGLHTFIEVGNALLTIRDGRLYRQTHATFESYCRERWGFSKRFANYQIQAAQTVQNLGTIVPIPQTESQARELSKVEPERQPEVWQRATESAPNGKVTAQHIRNVVDEYNGSENGYDWSEEPDEDLDSNEWYTPDEYIEAARALLGGIDLDPASCDEAQERIQAKQYFTKDDDGRAQRWAGRVWLNPPYGDPLPWVEKLFYSFETESVPAALLLVNTANSPQWSRLLWESRHTVCLLARRVRFWRPDRPDAKSTMQDQMIWYLGDDVPRFRAIFSQYGAIR